MAEAESFFPFFPLRFEKCDEGFGADISKDDDLDNRRREKRFDGVGLILIDFEKRRKEYIFQTSCCKYLPAFKR